MIARGCKSGCNMSMVGAYFVGFVTPTSKDSGQYWNDEIREVRACLSLRDIMLH